MYSTGQFAKLIKKSIPTLQRWDREGRLEAKRTPTNRRYYTEEQLLQYKGLKASDISKNVAYIRVSGNNQKDDLKNQKKFISDFALNNGMELDEWFEDIGSGLNYDRKNFNKLLNQVESGEIKTIIIAHKDRLIRFGYEWFNKFCSGHGCKILVINNDTLSPQEEMIADLISIIHVFSCRIYGLRSYKSKIKEEKTLK
jgi:predicted site-specific integrase-resolvase